jgi:hypothetical protein
VCVHLIKLTYSVSSIVSMDVAFEFVLIQHRRAYMLHQILFQTLKKKEREKEMINRPD